MWCSSPAADELPEVGKTYQATVKAIQEFGAFVEFIPGTEGLVHNQRMGLDARQ
jgi:polyribonucleotide nucleotidyltransferase